MATRPTIRTVAERAGVSTATVSRVLSQGTRSTIRISEATSRRVLDAARDLDYTPSALASGLRSRRTRMIGVIVPDVKMPFIADVISALDEVLGSYDHDFLLTQSDKARSSKAFERYRVDGIVLVVDQHGDELAAEYARRMQGRVVAFGRVLPNMPGVSVDNRLGEQLVLAHLAGLGHTRIAYCGASATWDPRQRRFHAFVESMRAAGLELDEARTIRDANYPDVQAGADGAARLMKLSAKPSAIVFYNDEMAIGGLNAIQSAGFSVPSDVSVVGFDDIPWARYCTPALTTVRQPIRAMAEAAVSMLLGLLDDPNAAGLGLISRASSPELVIWSSTGKVRERVAG